MNLIIREFQNEDAPAVALFMYDSFKSYLGDKMDTTGPRPPQYWIECSRHMVTREYENKAFVADLDGQATGYLAVTSSLIRGLGTLVRIGVDPDHSRLGIGTMLFQAADEFWRERHMRKIYTCVSSINPKALSFYKKMGFIEEGILRDHFFPGVNEHQMALFY